MLKRHRTSTPPPQDIPILSFDFPDNSDVTGFGHYAKRRRVSVPLPEIQPSGDSLDDDASGYNMSDEDAPDVGNLPRNNGVPDPYKDQNLLLHKLHLEHARRMHLNSSQVSNTTHLVRMAEQWDPSQFDIARYHIHSARSHSWAPSAQTTPESPVVSQSEPYSEQNRLLGNLVRLRMERNERSRTG